MDSKFLSGSYYPELFPESLNVRLDYVDSVISQNLINSAVCQIGMRTLQFFSQSKIFLKIFLKLFFAWINKAYSKECFAAIFFAIMRTHGGDAMMRWAILYGNNPELAIENFKNANRINNKIDKPITDRVLIDLWNPIDNFNQQIDGSPYCNGVRQIIIVGAGYDCRAFKFWALRKLSWKFSELRRPSLTNDGVHKTSQDIENKGFQSLPVYEVDLPHVQKAKKAAIRNKFGAETLKKISEDVYYIPCDLQVDSLKKCLGNLIEPVSTLILFEGVSYYLEKKSLEKVFMELRDLFIDKNTHQKVYLLFDFADDDMVKILNSSSPNLMSTLMNKKVTTLKTEEISSTLSMLGWKHIKTWDDQHFDEILEKTPLADYIIFKGFPIKITMCEL